MPSLEVFLRTLEREPPPSLHSPEWPVVIRTATLVCTHAWCRHVWRVPLARLHSTRGMSWACPGCQRTLHPAEVEVIE